MRPSTTESGGRVGVDTVEVEGEKASAFSLTLIRVRDSIRGASETELPTPTGASERNESVVGGELTG